MNARVEQLFEEQRKGWTLCDENYNALEMVKSRSLTVNDFPFEVQYNPRRIQSSAAKVDAKSIQERRCFLCGANRPAEQAGIPFCSKSGNDYVILVNPFPIFKRHLTIPLVAHEEQRIARKIGDMLEFASLLENYLIFYNGPKCGASAPDHFHFQAGNKGFLPIEKDIEKWLEVSARKAGDGVFTLHYSGLNAIVVKSDNGNKLVAWFEKLYNRFSDISGSNEEPMMNILAWKSNGNFYLIVYPRKLHRPTQFFAEGEENILISPASIDLGGIIITPLEKDYTKLTENDITSIMEQITINNQIFKELAI